VCHRVGAHVDGGMTRTPQSDPKERAVTQTSRPVAIAHVGITVPDLDAAVAWYGELLGLRLIAPPGDAHVDMGEPVRELMEDVLGPRARHMRVAHLASANGTAVELIEFVDPPAERPDDNLPWWRTGIFHFCVVDPDVAGLAQRIVAAGGRQRTRVWPLAAGRPYAFCYCEDPWGSVIEIYSHGNEQIFANSAPPDAG